MQTYISNPLNLQQHINIAVKKNGVKNSAHFSFLTRNQDYHRNRATLDKVTDDRYLIDGQHIWIIGEIRMSLTRVDYV